MPIYAYKCASCGHAKDMLRRMSDDPLTLCPECGQDTFQKQVTAAGFQLKGSGWYVTDFRGGNTAAPASPEGSAPAGDKGKGDKGDKSAAVAASAPPAEGASSSKPAAPAASPAPAPAPSSSTSSTKTSGSSS